ncbi:MAG: hypothetical protein RLZZ563_449 [Pseudomonadota bacterium]|jgi:hypothetical protein
MVNKRQDQGADGPTQEALLQSAMAALATNSLAMTQEERVAVAAELFRLADAMASKPATEMDAKAKMQAERRLTWLLRWLERS